MPINPNRAFRDRDLPAIRYDKHMTRAQNNDIVSYMISYGLTWSDFVVKCLGHSTHRANLTYFQAQKVIRYLKDTYDES